jgi:hypothetical protein
MHIVIFLWRITFVTAHSVTFALALLLSQWFFPQKMLKNVNAVNMSYAYINPSFDA